ncbi:50S ribosomal protein L24 [Flavobacteriales bacterium]|jgi:large subunit ribosomal protein L24|nr:50S ribosomal protein L24 [Flavobacteriales bacterium]MDC3179153.1 50S ribosomal protein L24 [Flavobacteriales bacterium]|tara:strand:- start:1240 stop:1545 length:306 start_codon:yes stop_codon:yes gene_type:complete
MKVKVGDNVKILSGDHKGSSGKIIKIDRLKNTALVEGVNLVKKHNKPNANNPKGGIVDKEAPINLSNISLTTKDGKVTRFGFRFENDGKKVRFSKKTNEII